jgi:hypothetical protein
MFEPETARFLESGCALIVAAVGTGGEPVAARGWGLTILADEEADVRLVLDADDEPLLERLTATGAIAITGADVATFHSVQLKGRVERIDPGTPADDERAARFFDDFAAAVERSDGFPRPLLRRLVPARYVSCLVRVEELFDQTPGPGAGAPIDATR